MLECTDCGWRGIEKECRLDKDDKLCCPKCDGHNLVELSGNNGRLLAKPALFPSRGAMQPYPA